VNWRRARGCLLLFAAVVAGFFTAVAQIKIEQAERDRMIRIERKRGPTVIFTERENPVQFREKLDDRRQFRNVTLLILVCCVGGAIRVATLK
jgi:hypothetical protein